MGEKLTEEPAVHTVMLRLCELCLGGAGGECHVPGCALWLNRAPDMAIHRELYEIVNVPSDGKGPVGDTRLTEAQRLCLRVCRGEGARPAPESAIANESIAMCLLRGLIRPKMTKRWGKLYVLTEAGRAALAASKHTPR